MRWEDRGRSRNLQDRRGRPAGRGAALGGSLGVGGFLILVVLSLVFGVDLTGLLGTGGGAVGPSSPTTVEAPVDDPAEEERVRFLSFVLDDAQRTWSEIFESNGLAYEEARLVLFRQAVESDCGVAPSAVGPFYCPLDGNVYLDLSFYDALRSRFGAPGDFAQAYVLAHEIGHHVQSLLGTAGEVREVQERRPELANDLSVALELQADCYAGVWAQASSELGLEVDGKRGKLERGDLEEGMRAAAAVGDDRLQGGRANPESFTHGSSEQRTRWFRTGYDSGDPAACDTFAGLP